MEGSGGTSRCSVAVPLTSLLALVALCRRFSAAHGFSGQVCRAISAQEATVKTNLIEGRHFIFLFFYFSQHVVDQNSPCSPPPANGQRRGCLWDAYAARLANGEWRCMGRHHLAHRGSSRFGDGDAAAWRAVTGRRNFGAHSYVFLSLPFLCADGFAVVRWGCMSGPWGKGGQGGIPA